MHIFLSPKRRRRAFCAENLIGDQRHVVTWRGSAGIPVVDPDWLRGIGRSLKDNPGDGIMAAEIMQRDRRIVAIISL